MGLRQRFKKAFKFPYFKSTTPFTRTALKGERENAPTRNFEAIGAIHRFDVATRGFFKSRSKFKDKLFRCPVTRKLLILQAAFFFNLGQFFLGRFASISEYLDLIFEESHSLSQDGVSLNTAKNIERGTDGSEKSRDIHFDNL